MAYVLVYASVNENDKLPRIGFVQTFRSRQEAVDAANDLASSWGWSADEIYSNGNVLCYADAYTQEWDGSIHYDTLTVKNTNSTSF